jgi:hypothetical protein
VFKGEADGGAEMSKRQLHKLSAREAETITEPGRHGNGGGLYLVIEAGAHRRRQWIFLYRVRGTSKRKELGLGPAKGKGKDGLSLADARLRAAEARKKLAEGKDPVAERRAEKIAGVTFGEFAANLGCLSLGQLPGKGLSSRDQALPNLTRRSPETDKRSELSFLEHAVAARSGSPFSHYRASVG